MELEQYFQIYHKYTYEIIEKKWTEIQMNGKNYLNRVVKHKPDFANTNKKALMFLNTASFKLVQV